MFNFFDGTIQIGIYRCALYVKHRTLGTGYTLTESIGSVQLELMISSDHFQQSARKFFFWLTQQPNKRRVYGPHIHSHAPIVLFSLSTDRGLKALMLLCRNCNVFSLICFLKAHVPECRQHKDFGQFHIFIRRRAILLLPVKLFHYLIQMSRR